MKALWIAFSMYSKIPVPIVDWDEKNMRYSICYFPLVGLVIGFLFTVTSWICDVLTMGDLFKAAILTVLPVLISGGIHLDGYCDTQDALSSYQSREKKLEIMKDPNAGAFAVIRCGAYYILSLGAVSQLSGRALFIVAIGFIVSRAFSGLAVVSFQTAKDSGLAAAFQKASQKKTVSMVMALYLFVSFVAMLTISPLYGVVAMVTAAIMFLRYRIISYRQFGGITGDVAGYFLQQCELAICMAVVIVEGVYRYGINHWW